MAFIFVASSDPESGPRGSRLLAPLIRWLVPDISAEALDRTVLLARKGVHFVTFGLLAGLLWRALSAGSRPDLRTAVLAFGFTVAYAISDEIHQGFVRTRVASVGDVVIDSLGAAFVLAGLVLLRRWRGRGDEAGTGR
jgi:VanZ family protein